VGDEVERRWRDDRRLVDRCRAGDVAAWETLIRRYRRLIYSVPAAYRLAPDDADDVFQRVAMKLLEHLDRLRRVEALASWLLTTARRECQAFRRSESRWEALDADSAGEPSEDPPEIAETLAWVEAEHALALALESLDPVCRGLLEALYVEDPTPSYREIADRLGRPVGSLGPTRSRCLGKLRDRYRSQGGRRPWGATEDDAAG